MTRSYLTKPLILISTFVVLVTALLTADRVSDWVETHDRELHHSVLLARAGELRARIEGEIHRTLYFAQRLAVQASRHPGASTTDLIPYVDALRQASPSLRSLILAHPGQPSRQLLPEAVATLDPDPEFSETALRALAAGRAVMVHPPAGPVGDASLLLILPIAMADGPAGTLQMALDLPALLRTAGVTADMEPVIAVREVTPTAGTGPLLFGRPALLARAAVRLTVDLPQQAWELAVAPAPGWTEESQLRVISFATALVLTLLAYVLLAEREREKQLALHDPLTALPNRLFFDLRLEHAISRAERHGNAFALLYLDLDDFKPVNDKHGHKAGDRVLLETGRRIRKHLRRVDTVARIGGDEFMVILDDTSGPAEAEVVARKLIETLGRPISIGSHHVTVGVSIGASFYPTSGATSDELIRRADQAMYSAKSQGKNRICFDALTAA